MAYRILVVEDEPDTRDLLSTRSGEPGTVSTASPTAATPSNCSPNTATTSF